MTAIATNEFKKTLIESLIDNVADSDNTYYIAVGKSDQWDASETVPTATNTVVEERRFRSNMQGIKKMSDVNFVATRYNWSSGTVYKAYSDAATLSSIGAYYVFTENQRVYICLEQGKDGTGAAVISTVNPDTTGTTTSAVRTADGYIWKYLFTLTASNANKYLSANFIPVNKIITSVSNIETTQLNVQNSAAKGSIVGYRIISGGADYPSDATATIVGNGSGATLKLTVDGVSGTVLKAVIDSDGSSNIAFGSGYSFAQVTSTDSNNGAFDIQPIISMEGIGADPRRDINANFVMMNAKPSGTEGGDFTVDQDFRQVGILKNPKKHADSDFTSSSGSALRTLTISGVQGTFAGDTFVRGSTSGAKAYVDKYDGNTATLFIHQNDNTGFKSFSNNESIVDSDNPGTNTATLVGVDSNGEVNPFSGELLYIENRNPVVRDAAQTEDIKIVFQL